MQILVYQKKEVQWRLQVNPTAGHLAERCSLEAMALSNLRPSSTGGPLGPLSV